MKSDVLTQRLYGLLQEMAPVTVRALTELLVAEGHEITVIQVQNRVSKMAKRRQAKRLPSDGLALFGPGPQMPRRQRTSEEVAEAKRRKWANDYARKQAKRGVPRRRPESQQPKVHVTRIADRAPHMGREVATAPPRETFPSTDAWLAANADKFERLPVGAVSKSSRLRFEHRRTA